jgi:hypothetical protein
VGRGVWSGGRLSWFWPQTSFWFCRLKVRKTRRAPRNASRGTHIRRMDRGASVEVEAPACIRVSEKASRYFQADVSSAYRLFQADQKLNMCSRANQKAAFRNCKRGFGGLKTGCEGCPISLRAREEASCGPHSAHPSRDLTRPEN